MATTQTGAATTKKLTWNYSDREEFIADIGYVANSPGVLPTKGGSLPNERYMLGIRLEVTFRLTNPASAGPSVVNADAPWSIIEEIDIEGYHRPRAKNEKFLACRTSDLYALFGMTRDRFPTFTNLVNSTLPLQNALVTTASATQDVRFFLDIWFCPSWLASPHMNRQQIMWALDAPNYDNPTLTLKWGDVQSLFGAGTQPALTAYGSATGTGKASVSGIFVLAGQTNLFKGFVPGRVWRYYKENTTGDILVNATNSRQYDLPRGYRIGRLLMKTGVKSQVCSSGNNAYLTLSDDIFSNITLDYGTNKIIRYYRTMYAAKEATANEYGPYPPVGYALVDFLKHGSISQALNCEALVAGPTGDVDVHVETDILGASNQAAMFLVEELQGKPQFVS